MHVDVEDSPSHAAAIAAHFDAVAAWAQRQLESEGGACVLVYCQRGVSRSCTVLLALLLHLKREWSLLRCWEHVKRARPAVRPNPGFLRALIAYERTVRGECSVRVSRNERGFAPATNRTPGIESCQRV